MPKYARRDFQVGNFWLSQRDKSPAWYRTWLEGKRTMRQSLETADYETAKAKLTEWFVLNHSPKNEKSEVVMSAVMARYWDKHGQFTVSENNLRLQIEQWEKHFGKDATVSEATNYAAQEAFKIALVGRGLSPSSVNKILAAGKAALRLAWRTGDIPAVPPITMLPLGHQEPMGFPIGPEDAAKLLMECHGHTRLFVLLLMGTLARPGAVRELEKSQIDFGFGLIDLNPPGRKQNKKRRPVVRLPSFLRAELEGLDGPLIQWRGKKVKSLKTAFKKARLRAKLRPDINTYSFRHGLAKWMRSRGVPKWEVEGQLGHRKGTTDIYAHVAPDYLQNALEAIEAYYARAEAEMVRLKALKCVEGSVVRQSRADKSRVVEPVKMSPENQGFQMVGERAGTRTQDLAIKSRSDDA